MSRTISKSKIAYWSVLLLIAAFFGVLNVLTTWKGDDLLHGLVAGNTTEHITNWSSLMRSQAFHYMDDNGRLADFFAQLFCGLLGKSAFNLVNVLVTVAFFHVMVLLIARGRSSLTALALALAFVMTLMPTPGETMLWISGATNYLWSMTATLILLMWLNRSISQPAASHRRDVVLFLYALLAGAMNESFTAGTLLGLMIYFALSPSLFKRSAIAILLGYVLGFVVILASPGGWARLMSGDVNLHLSLGQMISRRAINTCTKSVHFVTPVLVVMGALLMLITHRGQALKRNVLVWVFIGVLASIIALSITTSYRSYTAFSVLSFLIVAQWLHDYLNDKQWSRWLVVALLLGCIPLGVQAVRKVYVYKQYDDAVITAIKAAPKECILPAVRTPVQSRWVFPVNYDNESYFPHQTYYARYYHKSDLQFLAPDIYSRYKSGKMLEGGTVAPFVSETLGDTLRIMTFDGHPYSIIDAGTERPQMRTTTLKVYYASMEEHLGAEQSARLKRWGEFPEFMPMRYCCLNVGGRYYLVLPELTDDMVKLEFPYESNKQEIWRRFVKETPKN